MKTNPCLIPLSLGLLCCSLNSLTAAANAAEHIKLTLQGSWRGVTTNNAAGSSLGLDVQGHYAYFCDGVADLQIIDVRNPENPIWVGSYTTNVGTPGRPIRGGPAYDV